MEAEKVSQVSGADKNSDSPYIVKEKKKGIVFG